MKKIYLSHRVKRILIGLFCWGIPALICLTVLEFEKPAPNVYLVMLFVLSFIILVAGLVRGLWAPHRQLLRTQQMFLREQLFEELFQTKTQLSPENEQVLERLHELMAKQDVLEMSKKQAEYLALQNQINPHFLYNTLEAIRGDALCSGVKSIAQTAEALATFFRYTITEMGDLATIEDELENVENYFTIQQYRFEDKLKMRVIMDDDAQIYKAQIPKLTLQPIIENAIHHGLEEKPGEGLIEIRLVRTQRQVLISIKDNGMGMPDNDVSRINAQLEKVTVSYINEGKRKRGGIALRNVSQRIKLLFGEEYGLQLYSTQGIGTEVRIRLPLVINARDESP